MTKAKAKPADAQLFVTPVEGEIHEGDKITTPDGKVGKVVAIPKPPKAKSRKGTELARREPERTAVAVDMNDPFLAMIREVAVNKDLDVAKLDALLKMQERILDRRARQAFDDAFAEMELPVIDRTGRIEVREKDAKGARTGDILQSSPYAKWEDIVEKVTPIIRKHGFGLRFRVSRDPDGMIRIEGTLSGHGWRETCDIPLPHDSTGSKNSVQAIMSSASYGKRLIGCALLNIVSRGEDDDGAAAGLPLVVGAPLTDEQVTQVHELALAVDCPRAKLLDYMNKQRPKGHPAASQLEHLPASRFDEAIAACRLWEANAKERAQGKATK